jgi:hypothetical protein
VRSQYAISANLYCNPSFSVRWYHISPPDASEPNTTHGFGSRRPSRWGTHLMLVWSPSADGPHPDWQAATFTRRTHKLPQAPQGTGFMSGFPGPASATDHTKS